MSYKCLSCEGIFEDYELKEMPCKETGHVYIKCPSCGTLDDFEEVESCQICEEYFNKKEIGFLNGVCKECLLKFVTYEVGYEYIQRNKDLAMFVFEYIFDVKEPPEVNKLLMDEIEMMFQRKKVEDFLYNKPLLLNKIKEYVENDISAFSDYLKEKGVIR